MTLERTVVQSKDMMRKAILETSDAQFVKIAPEILQAMRWTLGFWQELNYSYKGEELCNLIYERCNDISSPESIAIATRAETMRKRFCAIQVDPNSMNVPY